MNKLPTILFILLILNGLFIEGIIGKFISIILGIIFFITEFYIILSNKYNTSKTEKYVLLIMGILYFIALLLKGLKVF